MKANDKRLFAILISMMSGLRIGEVCALKIENIDFRRREIKVNSAVKRVRTKVKTKYEINNKGTLKNEHETEYKSVKIAGTKTENSIRIIPMDEKLCKILRELIVYYKLNKIETKYIIANKKGNYVHPRTMQNVHKRLIMKLGLQYKTFHVLRHTYASNQLEAGVNIKKVSERLGHKNSAFTLNRYVHSIRKKYLKETKILIPNKDVQVLIPNLFEISFNNHNLNKVSFNIK